MSSQETPERLPDIEEEDGYSVLPPPAELAEYEKLMPGSVERLFNMAEREQAHRHQLEKELAAQEARYSHYGQITGFVLAATSTSLAVYLALNQAPITAVMVLLSLPVFILFVKLINLVKLESRSSLNDGGGSAK